MSELSKDHYVDDARLAARQRLWASGRREPPFELIPWVLDQAGLTPGSTAEVLDLGCGNGAYLAALDARGHRGRRVAADRSFGMLAGIEQEQRVQLDAQQLPFRDGCFDVVLAAHMLYHVPERGLAAAECRRVLRPDGLLVASTNAPENIVELKALVESAVGGDWRMVMPHDEHFGLHNGAAQLTSAFEHVERVDCPDSRIVVTDADAVADYVASVDDAYQDQVDVEWSVVVDRVRAGATAAIERDGEIGITSAVGAFVCR
jgi:SAM-dependent methyltransferase